MERTFGIIKPNAVGKNVMGRIITLIEEKGFKILDAKMKHLSQQEAGGFYAEHRGKPFFESLIRFMTSERVLLMVLEREDAINQWRKLMGATDPEKAAPQSIRNIFGDSVESNAVHGSDSPASADREIRYFFTESD